ncbi:MAG: DUF285 domain-containing protein [Lachnospiraceae bacterium]|nr:DUF285 domain-containing protein [Lachnospiraceae bacterium]
MKKRALTKTLAMLASLVMLAGEALPVCAESGRAFAGDNSEVEGVTEEILSAEEDTEENEVIMETAPDESADTSEEPAEAVESSGEYIVLPETEETEAVEPEGADDPWKTPAADWYTRYKYSLSGNRIILENAVTDICDQVIQNSTYPDIKDGYCTIPGTATVEGKEYQVVLKPHWYLLNKMTADWTRNNDTKIHIRLKSGVAFYNNSCRNLFATQNVTEGGGQACVGTTWGPVEVVFDHVDFSGVPDMGGMFFPASSVNSHPLQKVEFLECKTSDVTRMDYMFYGCAELKEIDLSGLDTSSVVSMDYMFGNCKSLKELDLSGFDTSKVGKGDSSFYWKEVYGSLPPVMKSAKKPGGMRGMFYGCELLKSLDLSSFDTSNVKDMAEMFFDCTNLEALDLEHFKTSSVVTEPIVFANLCVGVTGLHRIFSGCESLKNLKIGHFDTSGIKEPDLQYTMETGVPGKYEMRLVYQSSLGLYGMFQNCRRLTELDLSHFNTSGVTDMAAMFQNCYSLKKLDISSFDTAAVTDVESMFSGCTHLTALDLSGFDLSSLTKETEKIFGCSKDSSWCVSLKTLHTPRNLPGEIKTEYGKSVSVNCRLPYVYKDSNGNEYAELPHSAQSIALTAAEADGNAWLADYEYSEPAEGKIYITRSLQARYFALNGGIWIERKWYFSPEDCVIKGKAIIGGEACDVRIKDFLFISNIAKSLSVLDGVRYEGDFGFAAGTLQTVDFSGLDLSEMRDSISVSYVAVVDLISIKTPLNLPAGISREFVDVRGKTVVFCDADGKEYTELPHLSYSITLTRKTNGGGGGKEDPEPVSGEITLNGEQVTSLKAAFKSMKDKNTDYVLELGSDVKEEKNLTIPKKAKSVTIKGNGHVIEIAGTKLTANAPLALEDVSFKAVTKKGTAAKFTLNAKKGLTIGTEMSFDTTKLSVNTTTLTLNGSLSANSLSCKELILNDDGVLKASKDSKISVKSVLKGNGGSIELTEGFNKPITLGGKVEGNVAIGGSLQKDGTQIFKASAKKISAESLKETFDVSAITENATKTHLYYFSSGKVCIFGESIDYNGNSYALWKDAVAAMNGDIKAAGGAKSSLSLNVALKENVDLKGGFKLPEKGYGSISINGDGHSMTFTGNIKLSGDTTIADTTLIKVNKKGEKVAGKVIKGKYNYSGPESF